MKLLNVGLLCLFLAGMASCGKTNSDKAEGQDSLFVYGETMRGGVIEMDRFVVKDTARYKSHLYEYKIVREADSTLSKVKDSETQNTYMDNHVILSIKKDGVDFFQKTFFKKDFQAWLDKGFVQNGILEGFVFDKIDESGLRFATSVSYPQSDMYIPLLIVVTFDGGLSVKKDDFLEQEMGDSED